MLIVFLVFATISASVITAEDYQGLFLGKLNTYAHQVSGDVYAVDEYTILIKSFFYDGLSADAFFWSGATVRPSNIGFIVPDETGRTNKLRRYNNEDITIRLPEDKKLNSIKWFSIWDIRDRRNLADIYIPEEFEPPSPQRISEFSRISNGVQSGPVVILDSKTIAIPELYYDGLSENTFFWVGDGPQPHSSGRKIPNEQGYLESLGPYSNEEIILELPGSMTVFEIDWLAIWNAEHEINYGSVIIPDNLNIPPSLTSLIKHESPLPNCEQLHRRLQLSWEIFGPQITFEVAGQIDPNDYIAFGLSGSPNRTQMIGADVSISYLDGHFGKTEDYNLTEKYPCTNVLGLHKGICPDSKVGGVENFQIHTYVREEGITKITYRRNLINTGDEGDRIFEKQGKSSVIWAIGKLNPLKEPRMHHYYPKGLIQLEFGRKPAVRNCYQFTKTSERSPYTISNLAKRKTWGPLRVFNQSLTTFYARLGVPGGIRGYTSLTGSTSPGLVWYINGLMAPSLFVKRGRTYLFRVEGGNNPHNARYYHPLYITDDAMGGLVRQDDKERKKRHVYAGIDYDRKGRPTPTASGRLCLWDYPNSMDARKADNYQTFIQFRNALNYTCEQGNVGLLQWTPNSSTPDVVYYQSFTQRNMGGKIFVLDDFSLLPTFVSGSNTISLSFLLVFTPLFFLTIIPMLNNLS
ncbi:protein Skeletor, isoforms B/C-like [Tetranychus urticae]|uniref:protein Skeletor, isoforms B/C-like n=1 Tax=Tetranychus urticae TaxID=32264 RepID=UPI00077BA1EA|nr:protein Skeletor, isoforms B/C-like [Tetranychus urticae]